MSNLYNASSYKYKIINLLLKSDDLIQLINPKPSPCDELDIVDVLLGGEWYINGEKYYEQGHIFDYNFASDETNEQKTFIFVETDIPSVTQNMFSDFNLYVCIFTDKRLVRLNNTTSPTVSEVKDMGYFAGNYANRIDILCDIVDRILNGNDSLPGLGNIEPSPRNYVSLFTPNNNKYYGKCLTYHISNYNEDDQCEN